jgi:hypothetical protein
METPMLDELRHAALAYVAVNYNPEGDDSEEFESTCIRALLNLAPGWDAFIDGPPDFLLPAALELCNLASAESEGFVPAVADAKVAMSVTLMDEQDVRALETWHEHQAPDDHGAWMIALAHALANWLSNARDTIADSWLAFHELNGDFDEECTPGAAAPREAGAREAGPEFERLLAEEEEIERRIRGEEND